MQTSTRPAVAPALHLVFVLPAVLALGAVNAARAQTVTLVLTPTSIDEDAAGTVAVTATVDPVAAADITIAITARAFANGWEARSVRHELSAIRTLTIAMGERDSTGTVTIDPVDNDGHTPQDRDGITVRVWGAVTGPASVDNPSSVVLSIVESDGDGSGPVPMGDGTVNGDRAVLTFNEAVVPPASFAVSHFMYKVNGGIDQPISAIAPMGNTLMVTLGEPVARTDMVSIGYTPPKEDAAEDDDIDLAKALKDGTGNPVYAFDIGLANNSPPRVVLALTRGSIGEADGTTTVTATVDPARDMPFMVEVAAAPDAGVTQTGTTLTFAANATESTGEVTIAANDNAREGANPEVTVSGTTTAPVTLVLPPNPVTLTIVDDDATPVVDDEEEPMAGDGDGDGDGEEETPVVDDPPIARERLAREWLARSGRIAAGHAVDALGERLRGGLRTPHTTLAGRAVTPGAALAAERPHWDPDRPAPAAGATQTMDLAELMRGSSFHLSLGAAEDGSAYTGPRWALWGTAAAGGFDSEDDDLAVDGDAVTLTLGADADWGRLLAGVAVSHSAGEGGYAMRGTCTGPRCAGEMESDSVGAYPYMRVRVTDRLSAWTMLGYGTGDLTDIEGGTGARIETDIAMKMAALGADGVVLPAEPGGGFGLAVRSEAMFMRTSWESAGGLAGGSADARRLRLTVVGSRAFALASDGSVTPSVELGLRHDGGDAGAGTGVELGGGLRYAGPGGLTLEARGRGLVSHKDADRKEWGASVSARLDPGAAGRGLSLTVAPVWGVAPGGASRVWTPGDAATGLAALDGAGPEARLDGELGYGFAVLRGRGLLTPYAGLSTGRARSRILRLGSRLMLGPAAALGFEGSRYSADDIAADNRLVARASLRW